MTDQEFYRPTGRSVWTATELSRSDEWVFRFSPATLQEFDKRLAQVKARGLKIEDIRASIGRGRVDARPDSESLMSCSAVAVSHISW